MTARDEARALLAEHAAAGWRTAIDVQPELLAALCDELDRAEAEVARMRTALRKTSDLIAANRLVLGEYMDPRYVAQVEDAARAALAETEETDDAKL